MNSYKSAVMCKIFKGVKYQFPCWYASCSLPTNYARSHFRLLHFLLIRKSHDDVINGNIFRVTGPLCGEFTGHRWIPRTKARDAVFYDLRLNKRLSKQSWGWWFETPSCPLWRHCNDNITALLESLMSTTIWHTQFDQDTGSIMKHKIAHLPCLIRTEASF